MSQELLPRPLYYVSMIAFLFLNLEKDQYLDSGITQLAGKGKESLVLFGRA